MPTIAGLFHDRERALQALDEMRAAGFGPDAVTIVASPTSAGEVACEAAEELPRPVPGFVDLGAAIGGQAERDFPEAGRIALEERIAQGEILLRVDAPDWEAAVRAETILLRHGAEQVLPGAVRD